MPTTVEWTLALLSNLIHLVLIFIILYWMSRFFHASKLQALQKRYPFSVYLMSICIIFYLIQHLFYKITFIHHFSANYEGTTLQQASDPNATKMQFNLAVLSLISKIFYCFSIHGMLTVLIARSWFIYFNTKWGLQIQKSAWSVHLNPHVASTFWFIAHRKDYGSPRWIKIGVITYYLSEGVLLLVFMLLLPQINDFIDIFFFLIEFIVLITLYNKIPQFSDVFHIKRELQLILRVGTVGVVLYIGYIIKTALFGKTLIGFMIVQCIFGLVAGSMVVILNSYVFTAKCIDLLSETDVQRNSVDMNHMMLTDSAQVKPNQITRYSLSDVLANNELIQAFFKHLLDEFSVELLLALTEMVQFEELMRNDDAFMNNIKEYIALHTNTSKYVHVMTPDTPLILAGELPRSHIVFASHADMKRGTERYLLVARDITKKYIFDGAEFEINISYECKQEILSFIRNCPLHGTLDQAGQYQLFFLFWEAKQTMVRLMHSAHQRCQNTNRYAHAAQVSV
eukprot:147549_1